MAHDNDTAQPTKAKYERGEWWYLREVRTPRRGLVEMWQPQVRFTPSEREAWRPLRVEAAARANNDVDRTRLRALAAIVPGWQELLDAALAPTQERSAARCTASS